MHIKPLFIAAVLCLAVNNVLAQESALVKGRIISNETRAPENNVQVMIPKLSLLSISDAQGYYTFSQVPFGTYTIIISGYEIKSDSFNLVVDEAVLSVDDIIAAHDDAGTSQESIALSTISMDNGSFDAGDESSSSQHISGVLSASRDPFLNALIFVFGPYRFQPRGYDRGQQEIQINGIKMNDVETGNAYWSQWGGLNDVFRGQSSTYGLQSSDYSFGGINGNVFFNSTASNQRKQTRFTYTLSNRTYRHRLMLTKSSGLNKKGWAYTASFSRRWAEEAYIPGTFSDGYSYFFSLSKETKKNAFHFTTFGVPNRYGKAYPALDEVYELTGDHYYNRNWGYQEGKKRNARVTESYQPIFILNHEYKPNEKFRWNTAAGYQFGKYKNSYFDWYNGQSPWPNYYRNLPSFYYYTEPAQPETADIIRQRIRENPNVLQVNWDRLYDVNRTNIETVSNANGIEDKSIIGKRSLYVIGNDVDDINKLTLNTYGSYFLDNHIQLFGGISFIKQHAENYRELEDLLGGEFYVNLNQFAERTYVGNNTLNQNNLDQPNGIIKEGDRYGYNYKTVQNIYNAWGQGTFSYNHFDFFATAKGGLTSFFREGLYRNGLYPNESLGKAEVQEFFTYSVKGGATYKINGRNYLFANVAYMNEAPTLDNIYISPRIRNTVVDKPQTQKTQSFEAGYLLKSPKLNGRLVGYVTDILDETKIQRFYNDEGAYQTFVNYVMQGINTRFTGTEAALNVMINTRVEFTGVVALGQAFYTNNPLVSIYRDNDTTQVAGNRKVYINNLYLGVGPQSAYTFGINYNAKRRWYANLNMSYVERNYLNVAIDRRSSTAVDLMEPGSAEWHSVLDQEELRGAYTLNLFAGKSFQLSKAIKKLSYGTYLYVNVSVNNLLNNKDIKTGGFEQLRYTYGKPGRFPSRYFYGFGINYLVNISLKF